MLTTGFCASNTFLHQILEVSWWDEFYHCHLLGEDAKVQRDLQNLSKTQELKEVE